MGLIYKAVNQQNGKIYIGQTTRSLQVRKQEHYYKKDNTYFHLALQKYDEDTFIWSIIEQNIPNNLLNEREQYWIQYYNSNNREKGYNMTSGGDNTDALNTWRKQHPELVTPMAQAGYYAMQNKLTQNPELELLRKQKAAQSNREYAKSHPKEKYEQGRKAYLLHKEERDKQFEEFHRQQSKRTLCVETGIIYSSASEAYRQTHISQGNISAVCRGQRETAGGYHWKYID